MANNSAELNVATEVLFGPMVYEYGQTGPYGHMPVDVAVLAAISRMAGLIQSSETRTKLLAFCKLAIESF